MKQHNQQVSKCSKCGQQIMGDSALHICTIWAPGTALGPPRPETITAAWKKEVEADVTDTDVTDRADTLSNELGKLLEEHRQVICQGVDCPECDKKESKIRKLIEQKIAEAFKEGVEYRDLNSYENMVSDGTFSTSATKRIRELEKKFNLLSDSRDE